MSLDLIATIYGETPQGGTTEAPVALTGVDSAILFEQHTPINLAKPNEGESNGISIIANADGSVTTRGTATKDTWPVLVRIKIPSSIVSGDITISLSSPASVGMAFQSHSPSGKVENVYLSAGYTSVTTKIKSGYTGMHIFLSLLPDQTIDETFHIMIAQGIEPVPFVPYVEPSVTPLPIPRPLRRVGDVKDKCVTRQDYESAEKLVVTYNVGFVELDGTENVLFHDYGNFKRLFLDLNSSALSRYSLEFSHGEVGNIPTIAGGLAASFNEANLYRLQILGAPDTWTTLGVTDTTTAKTWLAAQKAAGTPVQIAYQLATPEVYATDPVDIFVETIFPIVVFVGPITYKVVAHMHPFKTDWKVQPKTPEGYYNGDWFEIEDYNHILDNYQTIYKIAKALYPDLQIPTFVSPTLGAPTKASEINTIERTIDAFKTLTIALSDVGATKTWLDNGNLFNFEDINRWEQVALSYYTVFLGQVELLPKLQFKLGGAQF